jgi:hypothetical protein
MKNNLKLFISSLIIILTLTSSQTTHGMEVLKPITQDLKRPLKRAYVLGVSSDSDTTEDARQKRRRGKEIRENPFKRCPKEIRVYILERAVINNYLSNVHIHSLKLVCQEWHGIISKDFVDRAILSAYELLGCGEIYKRFLKGVLIYRPQEGSDVGMVTLPIAALKDPLEGRFNLSQCGDIGKYLSISTGYRKKKKAENENKVEIWFAPRFLITKELNMTPKHLQEIYGSWKDSAEVGIFWTWGGWDDSDNYDYLTTKNMDNLSKVSLYENWQRSNQSTAFLFHRALRRIPRCADFMLIL